MGADRVFDLAATSPEERLEAVRDADPRRRRGRRDRSGRFAAPAIEEGWTLARDGGRYVIAGHYTDVGDSPINAHHQINRKHLEIRGCWGSEAGHFLRALSILERYASRVPVARRSAGARYRLDELNEALADAEAMRIPKALVDPA